MSKTISFAALLCTDGRLVCRKPICFTRRYEKDWRLKVVRFVKHDEASGHSCISCGEPLTQFPAFLKPSRSEMLG